ncbi:MAG: cytochrome c, partial [Bacteroidia bacterium]|nr:cytochrome c [Bacteroidia bacterium]
MSTKHTFTALTLALSIILGGLSQSDSQKYNRIEILPSDQRSGDPEAGFNYLVNGAYVHSGIPFDAFGSFLPKDSTNILNREGQSAYVTPTFNLTEHDNGVKLLTPNCLTCHADKINGEFIVGLGNNSFDYTINTNAMTNMLSMVIKQRFTEASKEWEAFEAFHKSSSALSDNITTKVRGINPADKLTSVLVAHRDNQTLEWLDKPALEIPEKTIPTDVPAWWLLKKKNAMFSTGIGRGDFSRFLMASSLLTLKDSSEAAQIDKQFPNVLAWINTIEPPKYPKDINHELAQKGKKLFDLNCSSCHGTYGKDESYPNLLISLEEVGTDPELSKAYTDGLYSNFVNW